MMNVARLEFRRYVIRWTDGLSKDLFFQILKKLPSDTSIVGFFEDSQQDVCGMLVQSKEFKKVARGEKLPSIHVVISETSNGYTVEDVLFNNTLKEGSYY